MKWFFYRQGEKSEVGFKVTYFDSLLGTHNEAFLLRIKKKVTSHINDRPEIKFKKKKTWTN